MMINLRPYSSYGPIIMLAYWMSPTGLVDFDLKDELILRDSGVNLCVF